MLADLLPAAVADGRARRRWSSWNWRWPPSRRTGTSPPNCTCSPAGRHDRRAGGRPAPLRDPSRPALRRRPASPTCCPARWPCSACPAPPTRSGWSRRAGRGTPDRRAARRRARLVPAADRRAVRADPRRARPRRWPRPLTAGFPSTTPTSLVSLGTGAAPGAHGVLGFTVRVPGTDRVLTHIRLGRRPGPAALAAGADPVRAGPRGRGGGDRGEPAGVRRQRADGGGQPGRRLPGRRRRGRGGRRDAGRAGRRRRARPWSTATTPTSTGTATSAASTRRPGGSPPPRWTRLVARLVDGLPPDAALLVTADHGQLDVPADAPLRPGRRPAAARPACGWSPARPGCATCTPSRARSTTCWPPGRRCSGDAAWVRTRDGGGGRPAGSGRCPRSTWAGSATSWSTCHDTYAVVGQSAPSRPMASSWSAYHGSDTAAEMTDPAAGRPRLIRRTARPAGRRWCRTRGLACRDGPQPVVAAGRRSALRAGRRRLRLHRSCTSTWTPSSPPSRCAAGPSCAAGRSSSAASARAAWSARPATRPAGTASAARCRPCGPGALCPHAVFLPPDFAAYTAASRAVMRDLPRRHAAGRAALPRRGVPRRGRRPAAVRPPGRDRPADPRPGRRASSG